jgi:hypothetical protein
MNVASHRDVNLFFILPTALEFQQLQLVYITPAHIQTCPEFPHSRFSARHLNPDHTIGKAFTKSTFVIDRSNFI